MIWIMEKILKLFNKPKSKNIYAVYEDDLLALLESVGLKDKVIKGEEKCFVCGKSVVFENLYAVIKIKGEYKIMCSSTTCMNSLNKDIYDLD